MWRTLMCSSWTRSANEPPGEADDTDPQRPRHLGGEQYVPAGAARAQGHQTIAWACMGLQVARENLLVPKIVPHARQVTRVADGAGGQGRSVVAIPTRQFLGEVHRIAHRAAVAAREDTSATLESVDEDPRR